MKSKATGIKRLFTAFDSSMAGFSRTYKDEAAFRQECWLALVLLPLAFIVGDTAFEIALLIASVFLVMIAELLNTAVEAVVDRIGAEFHELSGKAKDAGSAAVLLAMLLGVVVWIGVLLN